MPALTARVDSRPLAVTRIAVGVATLLTAAELHSTFGRILDGIAPRVPMPGWPFAVSEAGVAVWLIFTGLAGVALIAGFWSRTAAAAVSISAVVALVWDQQTYSSHLTLLAVLAAYMACGNPGARWSLDARRRGPAMSVAYWPQFLIVTQISVVYLFAAISKLQPDFLSGEALATFMRWTPADLKSFLPWFPSEMALRTLSATVPITELFLAVGLLLNRTRGIAVMTGLGLHLTIVLTITPTLPLVAFALLCVPTYWLHEGGARLAIAGIYRRPHAPASNAGLASRRFENHSAG